MTGSRVRLTFPAELVREAVVGQLVRRFDVMPNIRRADVSDDVGWMVCELDGVLDPIDRPSLEERVDEVASARLEVQHKRPGEGNGGDE